MNIGSSKKGYALSLLMIALLVISLGVVALIPVLSMKKDTFTNTSAYVKKCIVDESAASMSTTACLGAKVGLTKGFDKDYNSVLYYLNNATYTTAALKVVKASCDEDGSKACNILLDRCASNSDSFANTCNIASLDNDLYYYISMASSDSSTLGYLGKDYIKTKGVEYYLQGMPNFKNAVDAACNANINSTACDIAGETKTRIYNFNSPQRSDFFESKPTNGTNFHDGIVDLIPGQGGVAWAMVANLMGYTPTTSKLPISIVNGSIFTKVIAGESVACGLTASGQAYCWGANWGGELGNNTSGAGTQKPTPEAVWAALDGNNTYKQISGGNGSTCALNLAGKAYCWGNNGSGQLGDNTVTTRTIPTAAVGPDGTSSTALTFDKIYASGYDTVCGLTASGQAYCWGQNRYGEFGNNTTAPKRYPTQAAVGLTLSSLSKGVFSTHRCGITTSNAAYCWGDNVWGEIGNGESGNEKHAVTPVSAATDGNTTYSMITTGFLHTCALNLAGKAYCWGTNSNGEVGDNTTTFRTVPKPVNTGLSFTYIDAGHAHTCALTATGDVWCWGRNSTGALGDNTATNRTSPVKVQGGYIFTQVSAGADYTNGYVTNIQNTAYLTTTNNNNITGIVGGVKSCTITATELANTKIRGLVSFDGRVNWKKCTANCDNPTTRTWSTITNANLAANIATGNTITEIQQELTNFTIGTITGQTGKLDFAFYLETGANTPYIDTVSITFLKGR